MYEKRKPVHEEADNVRYCLQHEAMHAKTDIAFVPSEESAWPTHPRFSFL